MELKDLIHALTAISERCTINPRTNVIHVRYSAPTMGRPSKVKVITDDYDCQQQDDPETGNA